MTLLSDLALCLRFFSRLPIPPTHRETEADAPSLASAAAVVPVAGAIIAVPPSLVLAMALAVGLPPMLAGPLGVAALVAITGALHEDGLADCADGFGGGRSRDQKLAIMRDSRIGTFGACAIALSLYLRAGALGIIAAREPMLACATLIAAAGLSRTACLMPLALLPPARRDGVGAAAGEPSSGQLVIATGLAMVIAGAAIPAGASVGAVATAVAVAAISTLVVVSFAWRQISGQTGDVAGAAQQIVEIAVLLTFASI